MLLLIRKMVILPRFHFEATLHEQIKEMLQRTGWIVVMLKQLKKQPCLLKQVEVQGGLLLIEGFHHTEYYPVGH
jgi:hypothetical protein